MRTQNCGTGRSLMPFPGVIGKGFGDFFPAEFTGMEMPTISIRPTVDIVEEDDRILLKADMPGLEKSDIKVTVEDGTLAIRGSRTEKREEKKESYTRSERFMGTFSRSFTLPTWADGSAVKADYKNGVLTVVIPKTEAAKPREIEIKVG